MVNGSGTFDILLVEDSSADATLIQELLPGNKIKCKFHWVRDGVEAMEFLLGQDKFAGAPRPDLVLLDLNLPRVDGKEVLRQIRVDPKLKTLPVVILTTSRSPADVSEAYELNANSYLVKPTRLADMDSMLKTLEDFWFVQSVLPPKQPGQD